MYRHMERMKMNRTGKDKNALMYSSSYIRR